MGAVQDSAAAATQNRQLAELRAKADPKQAGATAAQAGTLLNEYLARLVAATGNQAEDWGLRLPLPRLLVATDELAEGRCPSDERGHQLAWRPAHRRGCGR